MDLPTSLSTYLEEWKTDETVAFALLGSYARGDAGPFSDVDVVRFVNSDTHDAESRSFLIEESEQEYGAPRAYSPREWLVVLSTATPNQVESWFSEPGQAVNFIAGLRDGRAFWDPEGIFAAIQQRACRFQWTQAHQEKANRLTGQELVGWIEEVHKGLEGLRRNDTGRLLNARFGLSWGLAWVMRVQRGVLSASDNAFFDDVIAAAGPESNWARQLRWVFGVTDGGGLDYLSLHEEVRAGLRLYCETFDLLREAIPRRDYPLIEATVNRIRMELGGRDIADRHDRRAAT